MADVIDSARSRKSGSTATTTSGAPCEPGVPERFITGDASDRENSKPGRVPFRSLANPLYHWTAMELKRPFGIDDALCPATADKIFDRCNQQPASSDLTAMGILRFFRVAVVCTTDDPSDTLDAHRQLAARRSPATLVLSNLAAG